MNNEPGQRPVVWWAIWGALQMGIFMFYFVLGGSIKVPAAANPDSAVWIVGFAPVAISCVIRWITLPQIPVARLALPIFVLGLAMAESACFFGIFLFPAHKLPLFIGSAVCIFQYIPFFAGRYSSR